MKKFFSIINLLTAIALTTIIPMLFSCFEQTQIIQGDSLKLGFPFTYYRITSITTASESMNFAVHLQLGAFFADIIVAYVVVWLVARIIQIIKSKIVEKK